MADSARCPSCQAIFVGPWCAQCGERRPRPELRSLSHYLGETWGALTDLDGRVWGSFRGLLLQPGQVTRDWWHGRRRPYLGPVQMFVLASVLFFLFSPFDLFSTPLRYHLHIDFLAHRDLAREQVRQKVVPEITAERFLHAVAPPPRTSAPDPDPALAASVARFDDFERRFDRRTATLARSMVFVMIPLVALASWGLALALHGPAGVVLHLVHATHFLAAVQLISLALGALLPPVAVMWMLGQFGVVDAGNLDVVYSTIFFGALALHLFGAARRAFSFGRLRALLYGSALVAGLLLIWNLYRALLFFLVFALTDAPA